jgi:exopolysaccharide biosynthesis polyprenyl glycosylphosphotransferase
MVPSRRHILIASAKLFDLAVMIFAFGLSTLLVASQTREVSLAQFLSMRVKVRNFVLFACFLLSWRMIFSAFGLYNSKRLSTRASELLDLLKATSVSSLTLFAAARLFRIEVVTPLFIVVFWAAGTTIVAASRLLLRSALARIRSRGRNLRAVLIVGTNCRALRFAQRIEAHPEFGYRLVGFVDDNWYGLDEFCQNGYKLVADLKGFQRFIRDHVVDEVVIALPMESCYARASRVAAACEEQGIMVRLVPEVFNLHLARSKAAEFGGDVVLTLYTGSPDAWQRVLKRPLDIVLSLVAIVALAPLGICTALLIKLTSYGPIFFTQERIGLNKRKFRMIKFRTMVVNAELRQREIERLNEATGPVFKIRDDPRFTPLGKLLRKTSIDELPQLFNVLRGDMSLVGPRPLPVRDYARFREDWQRRRLSVRPGITCLWQVNGRNSIPFDKWMELDMLYIDHWSLGLDLKILAKTIPAVLKGTGAA